MRHELWLEYGFVMSDGFHDVCWYNEGRWQEWPHFVATFIKWIPRERVYFCWGYGTQRHFLRGRGTEAKP